MRLLKRSETRRLDTQRNLILPLHCTQPSDLSSEIPEELLMCVGASDLNNCKKTLLRLKILNVRRKNLLLDTISSNMQLLGSIATDWWFISNHRGKAGSTQNREAAVRECESVS